MFPALHRPTRRKFDALLLVASLIATAHGCHNQPRLMKAHRGPPTPVIGGTGHVLEDGQFLFRLARQLECEQRITETWCIREDSKARDFGLESACAEKDTRQRTESLPSCEVRVKRLTVAPQWGEPVSAEVGADGTAVFTIDWAMSRIDPLADDAPQAVKQAWVITSEDARNRFVWTPGDGDIRSVLAAIGRAGGMEISADMTADPDAEPAQIAIKSIEVEGGAFTVGQTNRITLTLQNRSPGPAYRVIARTRSGHSTLHDLAFVFGRIDGGKETARTLTVTLPASADQDNPMIVVRASGANVAEVNRQQRVSIRAAPKLPSASIALRCRLTNQADPGAPIVEAGKSAAIGCDVQNTGEVAVARVTLTAKGGNRPTTVTSKQSIAPGKHTSVPIRVPIPAGARADSELTIRLSAVAGKASAETSIKAKVVLDRACPDGLLTRPQYNQKRAKLKELLVQGVLAQEEFDNYEADLLRCLK
jgi:hypothetical protein